MELKIETAHSFALVGLCFNAACGGGAAAAQGGKRCAVTKILPVLLVALMGLHIVKPLGLPGLKRRGDFWKIAVLAIFIMALAVGFHISEA